MDFYWDLEKIFRVPRASENTSGILETSHWKFPPADFSSPACRSMGFNGVHMTDILLFTFESLVGPG